MNQERHGWNGPPLPRRLVRAWFLLAALGLHLLVVACVEEEPPQFASIPRWSCPTPTALPTRQIETGETATADGTVVPTTRDTVPYEPTPYGREPGPTILPTPYVKSGASFFLGQIVNLSPSLDIVADAAAGRVLDTTPALQVYTVTLTFDNRGDAVAFNPAHIAVTAIKGTDGRQQGGDWRWDDQFGEVLHTTVTTSTIRSGRSQVHVPLLAPPGSPQTVMAELGVPTMEGAAPTTFRVSFTADRDPKCDQPGTWAAEYQDAGTGVIPPAVPPGTNEIVAAAMQVVGTPYCWGGKGFGPCAGNPISIPGAFSPYDDRCPGPDPHTGRMKPFCLDCSGLVWWAYKQNGVTVLHGTENQSQYPAVRLSDIQPGDLMLFGHVGANGRVGGITHVGIYAGDLDGDGTGDLVHAAYYPAGTIIQPDVFHSALMKNLVVITRPPRGGL